MFKDYALCSQEELTAKRKRLAAKKNHLEYLSYFGTDLLDQKIAVNGLESEIIESEWAIAAKEGGMLSYIMYRLYRVVRAYRYRATLIYSRFRIIYPAIKRLWYRIWDD